MALANELPYLNFTLSSYEARLGRRTGRQAREDSAPVEGVRFAHEYGASIVGGEGFNLSNAGPDQMASAALTGTPGTGKSAVAGELRTSLGACEVLELALRMDAARKRPREGGWSVDLDRMRRSWTAPAAPRQEVIVGHLAHLLPVRDIIVLRCHPRELERRLGNHRRQSQPERNENLLAEATDVILVEAVRPGHRVWEIDTTTRTARDVAVEVRRLLHRRPPPSYGRVDWLADPWVTAHLLDWSR
jgi:adenylate kinase